MAWLIGKSTEDLASSVGDGLGGLLNATFGNIVEMLLCIAGIRQGEIIVVKGTLQLCSLFSSLERVPSRARPATMWRPRT
jgi:Ca2+:H+ antiporter